MTQELLGEEMTFSPAAGGGPFPLNGIFEEDTEVVIENVVTLKPTVAVKSADIPVDVEQDDIFTIRGTQYKVEYPLEEDAEGGAVWVLSKA